MSADRTPSQGAQKEPVIQIENVTIQLNSDVILKNINLTVYRGEILVVIGPSGGGKTVLLKTMAGIYAPKQGRVLCEGRDWQDLRGDGKHLLASKVGVQFQKAALFDSLTVAENISFPILEHLPEHPQTPAQIESRVTECLNLVGLAEARKLYPHELSGGMQLRLGIARAIALEPDVIFYDDPTAGLDPLNTDKMLELIGGIRSAKPGVTFIIVTHDVYIAYQLAGRIIMVVDQGIIETGSAEETKQHPDPRVQQFIHGRLEGPLTKYLK